MLRRKGRTEKKYLDIELSVRIKPVGVREGGKKESEKNNMLRPQPSLPNISGMSRRRVRRGRSMCVCVVPIREREHRPARVPQKLSTHV